MPRWPADPQTWKPRETTFDVPNVGTVECVASFVKSEAEGTGKHYAEPRGPWVENLRTHWQVTLSFNGQEISSPFSQGSAHMAPPDAQSVASCLAMDAQAGTEEFEEFASNFGYDSDSRKAYAVWEECRNTELRIRRMFGSLFDTLCEWANDQ